MDGVIEMANVDYPHSHTDEGNNLDGQAVTEMLGGTYVKFY